MLVENTGRSRVFIALGANLEHPIHGPPRRALEAALEELGRAGVVVRRVSPWYRTAPVPASDQPWYVNAVAEVETGLAADALLARMHEVEDAFGRVRTVPNAARLIDLDLLDFRWRNRRRRAGQGDPAASADGRPGLRPAAAGRPGAGLAASADRRPFGACWPPCRPTR